MITIRRADLDDVEKMVAAYTASWREGFKHMFSPAVFASDDFDQQRREECLEATLNDDVDTYVAENEGHVVGFITARREDDGTVEVDDIWLHPKAWGCGAATALVARVEDDLRAVAGSRLTAWIPEDCPRSRHFFQKIGWRSSGAIEVLDVYPHEVNRVFEYERVLV